ncbi:MAG: acetyltransferase [Ardenticatenaceae bacterium]|nr:acetyltransferase [Ardenticatenaceae bacterium]HBY96129.1 hypothetical protein [Chloroflexota bacterium]
MTYHVLAPQYLLLAEGSQIDPGVFLAYPTGRQIEDHTLVIGANTLLRTGTVVYVGSHIGADFQTGHNVVIREQNRIGDHVRIWNNTTVDYGCTIGNHVKIHTNVYLAQFTTIEDDVFLAPGVTITNDPHPGCAFSQPCMRGPTIKRGAQIGGGVTILPYVTIGEGSLVGAASVVTQDIPPGVVAYGNPARVHGPVTELTCFTGLTDRPYPIPPAVPLR